MWASPVTATTTPATDATVSAATTTLTTEFIPGGEVAIGDFVVGPGRVDLKLRPGETVVKEIILTNRIDNERAFEFIVEDMQGDSTGEQAVVLLNGEAGPYSIREYISLPAERVTLQLGERVRVPVTISIPPNAEPGGYYGAVLATTVQDDGAEGTGVARSPIVARIGTLFFIEVPGETDIAGELVDFSTIDDKAWYEKGPITFGIAYENTGSVHLNPYGELRIKNLFGTEVGFVELEPWFVLPKALRTREVTWEAPVLFGRYVVTASVNRGYDDVVDTVSTVVWVIPWKVLLAVFVGLFSILFVVRLFLRSFELKRRA